MGDNSKILQFKNQKLREQVEVHKREKASLEEKLTALQAKQNNYEDTLLCVNRFWEELNREIAVLASRVDPSLSTVSRPQDEGLDSKALASAADPFLQRLVQGSSWAEKQYAEHQIKAEEDAIDNTVNAGVELQVKAKCVATKAAFVSVLDRIDAESKARMQMKLEDVDASAEMEELRQRTQTLQQELDGYRAICLAAEARYSALQDELLKSEKEVTNLSNELADKQEDVSILQRKLMNVRTKAEEDERANAASAAAAASLEVDKAAASTSGPKDPGDSPLMLAEERKRLEKRTMELEEERKLSRQLRLDLREAKLALQDETRYLKSKLHQDMVSRLNALNVEFARHRDVAVKMRRDLDLAAIRENELKIKVGEIDKVERLYHILEARARDLEIQKVGAIKTRDEAQSKLQALNEKMGQADTVGQLKIMVATLQKEISMLQANNTKLKESGERLDGALADAETSRAAHAKLEAERGLLARKLKVLESNAKKFEAVKVELEDKAEDLRVFVEVLQSVVNIPKDFADIVTRAQRAEEKVASLQKQLSKSNLKQETLKSEEQAKDLKTQLEEKEKARLELELERDSLLRQHKELKEQLAAQKAELDAYIQEIDVIGGAYEDMQAQNTALLQQMTERDALNHALQSERLQLDQQAAALQEENRNCQNKVSLAEARTEVLQAREAQLQGQVARLQEELGKGQQKLQEVIAQLDESNQKCQAQEEAVGEKQLLIEAGQRQRVESQRVAHEIGEKLETERLKRQRLEEELKISLSRLERVKRKDDAAGLNKELEGELEDMRTLLRCSVCHERQKNVIITKCYHMFCKPCIQRNLDTRHRKCPGCGVAFGSQDVKNCFFT